MDADTAVLIVPHHLEILKRRTGYRAVKMASNNQARNDMAMDADAF